MGFLLVYGMFVVGFYAIEVVGALSPKNASIPRLANLFCGSGFAAIGAWIAFK